MADQNNRGRQAKAPQDIPRRGWRDVLLRIKEALSADHVSIVAAGVAFYGLAALFPTIGALISVAGLLVDPATVEAQLSQVAGMLPESAAAIIESQAREVAGGSGTGLGLAAVLGLLLALYGASRGVKTLIEGMNIAYDETEARGFVRLNLTAIGLTACLIFGVAVALAATVAAPAALAAVGLPRGIEAAVAWGRWPILALLTMLGLAILYRFGPSRATPRWRWVSLGAVVATLVWIAGSLLFSVYVRNFGSYNETYGTIGGVIILLTWLWLSAFVILLGAELNAESEHQTGRDSTTGPPQPMGERGAVKADTLGRIP